jgi:quercetin 2,3-dioxygenase
VSERKIISVHKGNQVSDGAGVKLKRFIGTNEIRFLDPFLMLDEFRSDNPKDYLAGFPDHPHRGFETVTYLIEGKMEHKDSAGNSGVLEKGAVQWMTAGKGIIHSEFPKQEKGLLQGYQLWVNLPSILKMTNPGYKDYLKKDWEILETDSYTLEILSGEIENKKGPAKNLTPVLYLHYKIKPNSKMSLDVPENFNGFTHLILGEIESNGIRLKETELGIFSIGKKIDFENKSNSISEGILVLGEPIGEPVVQYGPFVMNTEKEIYQAIEDFQSGNF